MKSLILCLAWLLYSLGCMAQNITKTIHADTIHLHGIIYNYNGKPAKNIIVVSRQISLKHKYDELRALTDSDGYFMLNGAKPYDTLSIDGSGLFYNNIKFENKGSRYVVIYLPKEFTEDINSNNPVVISARRINPKIIPSFMFEDDGIVSCIYIVQLKASPAGGPAKYLDYLKQRLHYPQKAIDQNIEGTVQIAFDVEKDGELANFKVLKGIGYGCEEEVISVLKMSPRWKPGINNGKPYLQHETVSFEFKLID